MKFIQCASFETFKAKIDRIITPQLSFQFLWELQFRYKIVQKTISQWDIWIPIWEWIFNHFYIVSETLMLRNHYFSSYIDANSRFHVKDWQFYIFMLRNTCIFCNCHSLYNYVDISIKTSFKGFFTMSDLILLSLVK